MTSSRPSQWDGARPVDCEAVGDDSNGSLKSRPSQGKVDLHCGRSQYSHDAGSIVDDVPAMAEQYAYDLSGCAATNPIAKERPHGARESDARLRRLRHSRPRNAGDGRVRGAALGSSGLDCAFPSSSIPDGRLRPLRAGDSPGRHTASSQRPSRWSASRGSGERDRTAPLPPEVTLLRHGSGSNHRWSHGPALTSSRKPSSAWHRYLVPHSSSVKRTGKELVARELHRLGPNPKVHSSRSTARRCRTSSWRRAVRHERGAFTGANATRKGAFERPAGNAVLDEIGDLPPRHSQATARARGGGSHPPRGNRRSTSTPASWPRRTAISRRKSRRGGSRDLFYRSTCTCWVPPLRDRLSDVPALGRAPRRPTCARFGNDRRDRRTGRRRGADVVRLATQQHRELRNVVERMLIATDGDELTGMPVRPRSGTAARRPTHDARCTTHVEEQKQEGGSADRDSGVGAHEWHVTKTGERVGFVGSRELLKIMRVLGVQRDT